MRSSTSLWTTFGAATAIATLAGASTVAIHLPLQACEVILKDAEIVEYFHVEVPERTPVLVSSIFLHPDFSPRLVDYPIKVVSSTSPDAAAAFQLTSVDSNSKRIVVEFYYPVEGLRGRFTLVQQEGKWIVKKRKLWEQ